MKGEIVRTVTLDGLRLDGILYEPTVHWKGDSVAVLHVHGMGGNFYENKFTDSISKAITASGAYFCSVNTRGAGFITDFELVGKREKFKRIGQVYEKLTEAHIDVAAWVDFLISQGIKKVVLQGHSLGCVKVMLYYVGLKDKSTIKKIILLSPPDIIGLVEKQSELATHKAHHKEAKKFIKANKPKEILTTPVWAWYKISAESYIDFFDNYKSLNVFPVYHEGKLDQLSRVNIPLLITFGQYDDIGINSIIADAKIYRSALTREDSQVVIIPGADHIYQKGSDVLADEIGKFLKL